MKTFHYLILAFCLTMMSNTISVRADETKPHDTKVLELVRQGKLDRAPVSAWGFDPQDSTKQFQAAIDSGIKTLVVDRQSTPWIVTPLKLRSDLELVFEEGSEVLAKQGEFKHITAALFRIALCKNVTLRGEGNGAVLKMRKADYHTEAYQKSEWRHGISVLSSSNIRIENLSIVDSGGDGIYLGIAKRTIHNENIVIKKVVCDGNNRQGISVIDAVNLLIEDTVLKNTKGTAPQAGIDFEPNRADESLKNCVMRNCVCEGNAGNGFDFYLPQLSTASGPLEISIENSISRNNRSSVVMTLPNGLGKTMQGYVRFKDCLFENDLSGILIQGASSTGAKISFENTKMVWNTKDNKRASGSRDKASPITMRTLHTDGDHFGNVHFGNFDLQYDTDGPVLLYSDNSLAGVGLRNVTGQFKVNQKGKHSVQVIDPKWCEKHYPPTSKRNIPMVGFSKEQLVPLGAESVNKPSAEKAKTSLLRVRRRAKYFFHAQKGDTVEMSFRMLPVGKASPKKYQLQVIAPDGTQKSIPLIPSFEQNTQMSYKAHVTGIHEIVATVGGNSSISIVTSNAPVACDASPMLGLVASRGTYYFYVPEKTKEFCLKVVGLGPERVKAQLRDPSGQNVWEQDNISSVAAYYSEEGKNPPPGIWSVKFSSPSQGVMEDFVISLMGIPGLIGHDPSLILVEKK